MTIHRLTPDSIEALPATSFAERGVRERGDLQRFLRANISIVAPDVLIISEEFGDWDVSRRRIDLLGIDTNATLVVIELKRDDVGAHMELQAIRYAAMVSSMTFSRAVDTYQAYLDRTQPDRNAQQEILDFLQWSEPNEDDFGRDVRIVLVAADFSKELTTAVLWLNQRDLDIRCVRLKPYAMDDETILDVQQVVPLPEAEEFMVRVREKEMEQREAARLDTGYWFMNTGDGSDRSRSWEDCRKYGFMLAGGDPKYVAYARRLDVGDKVFAYLSGHGYVGLGEVTAEAVPFNDFMPTGYTKPLRDLPLTASIDVERMKSRERCDWCIAVRWIGSVDRTSAVLKVRGRRSTLERIRQSDLVAQLRAHFDENGQT